MTDDDIHVLAARLYFAIAAEIGKGGSAVQVPMIEKAFRDVIYARDEQWAKNLAGDGHWRPVVFYPGEYRELTGVSVPDDNNLHPVSAPRTS